MVLAAFVGIHSSHWPEWVTAISTLVLAVGVVWAGLGFWDAKRTRHGELTTDLARRWDEPDMVESMIEFVFQGPSAIIALIERIYGAPGAAQPTRPDVELFYTLSRWPTLIETIGVLHRSRAISTKVVYRNWGLALSPHGPSGRTLSSDCVSLTTDIPGSSSSSNGSHLLWMPKSRKNTPDLQRGAEGQLVGRPGRRAGASAIKRGGGVAPATRAGAEAAAGKRGACSSFASFRVFWLKSLVGHMQRIASTTRHAIAVR